MSKERIIIIEASGPSPDELGNNYVSEETIFIELKNFVEEQFDFKVHAIYQKGNRRYGLHGYEGL